MKTAQEIVAFGQGNVEAFVQSNQILAAGLQDLGKQFAAQTQAQVEAAVSTFRALTTVKSVREAIDLQASFARASVEKAVAQTNQAAEASFKLANQAFAPIGSRVTLAVQTFARAA